MPVPTDYLVMQVVHCLLVGALYQKQSHGMKLGMSRGLYNSTTSDNILINETALGSKNMISEEVRLWKAAGFIVKLCDERELKLMACTGCSNCKMQHTCCACKAAAGDRGKRST